MHPELLAHISEDQREQTLEAHLSGTAQLAAVFAKPFGADKLAEYCGLLHDYGKGSEAFQRRLRGAAESVDHSTAGAQFAFTQRRPEAAFAIAGHHTGLPDGGNRKIDGADDATLFGRMKKLLEPLPPLEEIVYLPEVEIPPKFYKDAFTNAFFIRMLYSCLVDADYLDTEAFMNGAAEPRGEYLTVEALLEKVRTKADQWLNVPETKPINQIRNCILRNSIECGKTEKTGLFTLTVPTGGGKTFASLAFALEHAVKQGKKRVLYVIPYTSIIDQTAEVFESILGAENVLAHYSGADFQMNERTDMTPLNYRRALAAENWDAPVIVTTAVQFFESLFANRSSRCRKLHNLAESVIIFDEAQTLPVD